MSQIKGCLALAAVLALAACASNVSTIQYPNVGAYAPSDPAKVQILRAAPTRPTVQLAEINVDAPTGTPMPEIEGQIRAAAAKLGADAAVIVVNTVEPSAPVARGSWGSFTAPQTNKGVVAVAVKYR
jgi:hypothetical protein